MKMELSFEEIKTLINGGEFKRTPYDVETITADKDKLVLDVKVGSKDKDGDLPGLFGN